MPPDKPKRYRNDPVPEEVVGAYAQMIETLFNWRGKIEAKPGGPKCLMMSEEAREMFIEYYDAIEEERASLSSGTMKSSLAKLSGYVLRIALVLRIAEFASNCPVGNIPTHFPVVDEKTMAGAITLIKWFRRETQRVIQRVRPTEVIVGDREVSSILQHLESRPHTTARKVAQNIAAFDGKGGTDKAEKKLEDMVLKGLLVGQDRKAGNGIQVKIYSLPCVPNTETYAYTYAISESDPQEGENSVGVGEDLYAYITVAPTTAPKDKPTDAVTDSIFESAESKMWEDDIPLYSE